MGGEEYGDSPFAAQRVLVTGASGFLGKHLVAALARAGARVRLLSRPASDLSALGDLQTEVVRGDLALPDSLPSALAGVRTVFHLAGLTTAARAESYYEVNARGTERLAAAAAGLPDPPLFVLVSSLAAAGPARDGPRGEDEESEPISHYGRSKLAAERAVEEWGRRSLPFVILRPSAVYGPWDRAFLIVFKAAARGLVPIVGRVDRRYSLVFVTDVVAGILAAASSPAARSGVYNLAHREIVPQSRLLASIWRAVGREGRPRTLVVPPAVFRLLAAGGDAAARIRGRASLLNRDKARELLVADWTCDPSRLAKDVGFEAQVGLEEGVERTARWYRERGWL